MCLHPISSMDSYELKRHTAGRCCAPSVVYRWLECRLHQLLGFVQVYFRQVSLLALCSVCQVYLT